MERFEVIQRLLDLFPAPRYLEIGVDQGVTFHKLRAASKAAVDVRFAFDLDAARQDPANANCAYFEMTSDQYFTMDQGRDAQFDVVFLDGLHTFDQTLRDLLHSSYVLAPGGLLIVDDVMPSTYAASLPDLDLSRRFWQATNNPDGSWMGDVYRLVFFIADYMTSFSYATVTENHGQTILWRDARAATAMSRKVETIARLEYVDAVMGREIFNLQPFAVIESVLAEWRGRQ
ncbi:class I SAM-dependent methyltransferase [Sphingomonas bacterium]|uniref:class I SAM-dependent methyltransferase n=1 Tax=Sphingomonas bacterium TaxID=1895847 RepID=UPI001577172D|nr:class I SAM-dependent methyltransferase [Sphingomonas bacterium]